MSLKVVSGAIQMTKPATTWLSVGLKSLLLFLVLYGLVMQDGVFVVITIVCFGLSLVPPFLARRMWLPPECDACLAAILAAHVFLGMTLELYETSAVYDKVAHYAGTLIVSWLALRIVDRHVTLKRLRVSAGLLSGLFLMFAVSVGAVWEIVEFFIDQLDLVVTQRGLADTMYDLMADLLTGVTIALLFGRGRVRAARGRSGDGSDRTMQAVRGLS